MNKSITGVRYTVPPNSAVGEKRPTELTCTYDFRDEFGGLKFQKVRYRYLDDDPSGRAKTFRYWRPKTLGWGWGKPDGADSLLYRLPELLAAIRRGTREVWWTEGEKDADVAAQNGLVATSHHGGATKVFARQCGWFSGYGGRVYVVADRDTSGYYDACKRIDGLMEHAGLNRSQIRVVRTPVGKDLGDHYAAGLGRGDWRLMKEEPLRRLAAKYNVGTATREGYGHWLIVPRRTPVTDQLQEELMKAGYASAIASVLAERIGDRA